MTSRSIAAAAVCAAMMLATGHAASAAAFKDGHELLEAANSSMAIMRGHDGHGETGILALRFMTYVWGIYHGFMMFDLMLGVVCEPHKAVAGEDLLNAVHRFLSHGSVYGLEKADGEVVSPQEFLGTKPQLLIYLALNQFFDPLCAADINDGENE